MTYLPFLSLETWTLLITFICLFIAYGYWPHMGSLRNSEFQGQSLYHFWITFEYGRLGFFQMDMHYYRTYGRLWGIFEGRQPLLFTMDTRMIKTVLVKECFSYFINRRNFRFNGPFSDAVSNARDEDWRRVRGILSPLFASGHLKET
ncbi:hypothetical protein AAFF_G00115750 [Aldrovandia affinis]|uniref:Uncharacterized protein n=1 Tax=Aldrovandia affinis TaxID=143900 RepID=A0AAD7VWL3_9TELE|nr:hypothetical protein AAFF_G00115750 [Aldrovandia affinis]